MLSSLHALEQHNETGDRAHVKRSTVICSLSVFSNPTFDWKCLHSLVQSGSMSNLLAGHM